MLSPSMASETTVSVSAMGFWESPLLVITSLRGGFEEDKAIRRGREKIGRLGKFLHFLLFFLSLLTKPKIFFSLVLQNQSYIMKNLILGAGD